MFFALYVRRIQGQYDGKQLVEYELCLKNVLLTSGVRGNHDSNNKTQTLPTQSCCVYHDNICILSAGLGRPLRQVEQSQPVDMRGVGIHKSRYKRDRNA